MTRRLPSELYPTLEALQPPPGIEEFVKHGDRLVKTITRSARRADNTHEPQNVVFGVDKSMTPIFTKYSAPGKTTKQRVCWFHERFHKEAHTCEVVLHVQKRHLCTKTQAVGKRKRRARLSAVSDSPRNSKRLLYVAGYMIDSGSVVSVVPPTPEERQAHDTEQRHLHAAIGNLIKTFGTGISLRSWDANAATT